MPHIDAIVAVVEDMGRTLDFYRLLGFDIPRTADIERYVSVRVGEGLRFQCSTEVGDDSVDPRRTGSATSTRMGIALRCADAAEVDTTFQLIMDAGYRAGLEPFDAPWGSRHCRVLDPDGNTIDLFAPLP